MKQIEYHFLWVLPLVILAFMSLEPGPKSNSYLTGNELTFAEPVDISGGSVRGVSALDVADFNQDGRMDVMVLEGGAHAGGRFTFAWFEQGSDTTWIRHDLGNDGQFDDFIGSARCGDVDGDGDADLILSNDGHTTGPLRIYFYENPGKEKTLSPWPHYVISTIDGFHANDMRLADMDRDGKLDVIIRHKAPESVRILFQNTKEEWITRMVSSGQAGEGLAVGDIDRDGLPDITMTGHWLKTPADPRTGEYRRFDIEAGYKEINKATKEEVGDLNGDGRLDVVLSPAEAFPNYGGANYDLAWYEGPTDPTTEHAWKKRVIVSDFNNAHCLKLADLNNDGRLDILTAVDWGDLRILIFLNKNAVFEGPYQVTSGKGIYSGAVADMDGDGDLDIVGEDKYAHESAPWLYENLVN